MRHARTLSIATTGLCLLAAGCGSSDKGSSTSTSSSTAAGATTTPAVDLRPLLLGNNALPGYTRSSATGTTNAADWAAEIQDDAARLRKAGWVAGARADLRNRAGNPGLTLAERFKTAAQARKEIAATVAIGGHQTRFPVPGIPGAYGSRVGGPNGGGAHNVLFSKGTNYFVVGYVDGKGAPTVEQLIAAAKTQYDSAP